MQQRSVCSFTPLKLFFKSNKLVKTSKSFSSWASLDASKIFPDKQSQSWEKDIQILTIACAESSANFLPSSKQKPKQIINKQKIFKFMRKSLYLHTAVCVQAEAWVQRVIGGWITRQAKCQKNKTWTVRDWKPVRFLYIGQIQIVTCKKYDDTDQSIQLITLKGMLIRVGEKL